jgi:hypothetical protein
MKELDYVEFHDGKEDRHPFEERNPVSTPAMVIERKDLSLGDQEVNVVAWLNSDIEPSEQDYMACLFAFAPVLHRVCKHVLWFFDGVLNCKQLQGETAKEAVALMELLRYAINFSKKAENAVTVEDATGVDRAKEWAEKLGVRETIPGQVWTALQPPKIPGVTSVSQEAMTDSPTWGQIPPFEKAMPADPLDGAKGARDTIIPPQGGTGAVWPAKQQESHAPDPLPPGWGFDSQSEAKNKDRRIAVNVKECARCGCDHEKQVFTKLMRPSDGWTYFSVCPKTSQPIMLMIADGDVTVTASEKLYTLAEKTLRYLKTIRGLDGALIENMEHYKDGMHVAMIPDYVMGEFAHMQAENFALILHCLRIVKPDFPEKKNARL